MMNFIAYGLIALAVVGGGIMFFMEHDFGSKKKDKKDDTQEKQ